MSPRPLVAALLLASLPLPGFLCQPKLVQQNAEIAGFVEPHTPGSGSAEEFPLPAGGTLETLLGPDPDLNRVSYVRTREKGPWLPPRVVVILIPGFLGGAKTFDPLARDLVERFHGRLEVWAVDRRPNQFEDRLGAEHALAGIDDPACQSDPPAPDCSIFEGTQFYFPDVDLPPEGDFPSGFDKDVDLDGEQDEQLPLVDRFGALRGPQIVGQDDVRFMAHWGLDTYFRDWKLLIEMARARVGSRGLVLLGGHSQGTTWATTFAAYDFDPRPGFVKAGHSLVDGLILLEGGGVGPGVDAKPTLSDYQATVAELETPGGPDVFLPDLFGGVLALTDLGTAGELASIAGVFQPQQPAVIQRTPTFGSGTIAILLGAPATNQAVAGLFLDDDFSPNPAFRASMGFTDDGPNVFVAGGNPLFPAPFYIAGAVPGNLRTWKDAGDPTLPTCPPNTFNVSPGCAILDNGPPSDPMLPADVDPPVANGLEREVTRVETFLRTQFGNANGFEWYFASGRPSLDFAYGNDSSALVAEHLTSVDPDHEGPLVVTQNSSMDLPVICFGGSNGLTPEEKSFDRYLNSIATPLDDQHVHIIEGYAHVDVLSADDNEVLAPLVAFIQELRLRKLFHPSW